MTTPNVFGNAITNSTLETIPEYACKLRIMKAHAALNMKHEDNSDVNARGFAEKLKERWSDGIASICLIYNATGDTIKLETHHDWAGKIGPGEYPVQIANGQWGAFLHMQTSQSGSSGCVVYRGKKETGKDCDWMLSWSNPSSSNKKAYTEIREPNHHKAYWPYINTRLNQSGLQHSDTWNGCFSTVTTSGDTATCPIFEAIFTLKNAA